MLLAVLLLVRTITRGRFRLLEEGLLRPKVPSAFPNRILSPFRWRLRGGRPADRLAAPNDVCFRTTPPVLLDRSGEYGDGACDVVDASVFGDFAAGFVSKALPFAVCGCLEAMLS